MSKVTKILRSPKKFIADARSNKAIRRLRNMSPEERERFGVSETSRVTTKPNNSSNLVLTKPKIARIDDMTLSRKLHEFERKFPSNIYPILVISQRAETLRSFVFQMNGSVITSGGVQWRRLKSEWLHDLLRLCGSMLETHTNVNTNRKLLRHIHAAT